MVTEGEQVVIGDTDSQAVGYEVLCRDHHMRHMTAASVRATMGPEPLHSAWSPDA